jgi:hypothetical protein
MDEHVCSRFQEGLDIDVVYVNPETDEVCDDGSLNTKLQVWLEAGAYEQEYDRCAHDFDLDCGGNTFEDAIIALAILVESKYGAVSVPENDSLYDSDLFRRLGFFGNKESDN